MKPETTFNATALRRARAMLDELLRAAQEADRLALTACLHEHGRLRTAQGEQVDGREAVLQWFAAREQLFHSLDVRLEYVDARSGAVEFAWWAATDRGAVAGSGELVFDGDGRVADLRVAMDRTDRAHRGVRVEVVPPVGRIVLDRVDKRNAVSQPMLATMTSAVRDFARRPDLRAVVLHGEGPVFCAGEDVGGFHFPDEDAARRFLEGPLTFFEELEALPFPVFVAAHGAALGFGSEVLLVVDGVAAAPGTGFGFAEIDHGAVPSVLVTRGLGVVGRRRAADLALTGRRIGPGEAMRMGLVHQVSDHPVAQVEAWAEEVAAFDHAAAATIQHLVGVDAVADHARARDIMPRVLTHVEVNLP